MKNTLERGRTTTTVGRAIGIGLVLVCLLIPVIAMAQAGVPAVIPPKGENEFQAETHFLTFIGSFKPESAYSEAAYYKAIDPFNTKPDFPSWLKNAGFIDDVTHWHPYGPQVIACDLGTVNGCDVPAHNPDGSLNYLDQNGHDDNVVNTDSHVIVLNAADLGFVRNQFIRCVDPSNAKNPHPCQAKNPIMYTYLENYPVGPFAGTVQKDGSCTPNIAEATATCFPTLSGFPNPAESAAAMESALNRPLGELATQNQIPPALCPGQNFNAGNCTERIADVAFEWVPPLSNPTSSSRMGTLYAYIFQHNGTDPITKNAVISETLNLPNSFFGLSPFGVLPPGVTAPTPLKLLNFKAGNSACSGTGLNSCTEILAQPGDKFPPNLDGAGFKFHPGVCLVCHGGQPTSVTSPNPYPHGGNINGFRFLPLDTRNLLFTSDSGGEQPALATSANSVAYTDRYHQEGQLREYNLSVLNTIPTNKESDGTGATRVAHARELITGWYTDPGQPLFNRSTQNSDFVPAGWLGKEDLYHQVVSPSCRSCHLNREVSLDFGTYANFTQESDILELAVLPGCSISRPNDYSAKPGGRYMPLAHITYQRYWSANTSTGGGTQELPFPSPPLSISSTSDQIANTLGFGTVAGYCATNP
jgi:hypothetical protein